MKAAPANVNGGWGGGGSKCGGGGWRRCDFVPLKAAQAIQRNISVAPRRKGSSRTLGCGREERCRPCRASPHTHSFTRAVAVEVAPESPRRVEQQLAARAPRLHLLVRAA